MQPTRFNLFSPNLHCYQGVSLGVREHKGIFTNEWTFTCRTTHNLLDIYLYSLALYICHV